MASLGIRVHINKRPSVAVVVLGGTRSSPVLIDSFALTTNETSIVEQVHDLSSALGSLLDGLDQVDGVVIRRADVPVRASKAEGPKTRLLVEGGLIRVCRNRVVGTVCASARDLAQTCGSNKADMDSQGEQIIAGNKYLEAAAAAWSILDA